MRRGSGVELGIVLAVGVVQVLGLAFVARYGGSGVGGGRRESGFMKAVETLLGVGRRGEDGREGMDGRRPLLAAAPRSNGETEARAALVGQAEGDEDEEEEVPGRERYEDEEPERQVRSAGYGSGGIGPRVEPSHQNPWARDQRG